MFRTATEVRASIAAELVRIFDYGAEIRFYTGPQPAEAVPVAGWVATRPVTALSEAGTPAGQAVTFTANVSPYAAAYAKRVTDRVAPGGVIDLRDKAAARVAAATTAYNAAAAAAAAAVSAWSAAEADKVTKVAAQAAAVQQVNDAQAALNLASLALSNSGATENLQSTQLAVATARAKLESVPLHYYWNRPGVPSPTEYALFGVTPSPDSHTPTNRMKDVMALVELGRASSQTALAASAASLAAAEATVATKTATVSQRESELASAQGTLAGTPDPGISASAALTAKNNASAAKAAAVSNYNALQANSNPGNPQWEADVAAAQTNVDVTTAAYDDAVETYAAAMARDAAVAAVTTATTALSSAQTELTAAATAHATIVAARATDVARVELAAQIVSATDAGVYGQYNTAYQAAVEARDAASNLYLVPEIAALATARDNAQANLNAKLAAQSAANVAVNTATELVGPMGALSVDKAEKQGEEQAALTALNIANANLDSSQLQADEDQRASDTALAEHGRSLAALPASGWCRVVHPAYPDVFFDGTFGQEGDEKDFTVNPEGSHSSLVTLHPITFTIPAV